MPLKLPTLYFFAYVPFISKDEFVVLHRFFLSGQDRSRRHGTDGTGVFFLSPSKCQLPCHSAQWRRRHSGSRTDKTGTAAHRRGTLIDRAVCRQALLLSYYK